MRRKSVIAEVPVARDDALHMRPLTLVVELAAKFRARVRISRGTLTFDASNTFGVLQLAGQHGPVRLEASGRDAERAVRAIQGVIEEAVAEVLGRESGPAQAGTGPQA